jgi:hypothetical protein
MEPEKRGTLSELAWQDINEPGACVEIGIGDFTGIPKRLLSRQFTGHGKRKTKRRRVQVSPNQQGPVRHDLQSADALC